MSFDLILLCERSEGRFSARVADALTALSAESELQVWFKSKERRIRFALELPKEDERCASIGVRVANRGRSLSGTTRSHGAPVLYWCFYALAERLGACRIIDPQTDETDPRPNIQELRVQAVKMVRAHEQEVLQEQACSGEGVEEEPASDDEDARLVSFFESLVASEELVLNGGAEQLAHLRNLVGNLSDLYEALLEHDGVDDIFLSEGEFIDRFSSYRYATADAHDRTSHPSTRSSSAS